MNNNTKRKSNLRRKSTKTGDRHVISSNLERNMNQVIFKNSGGGSITKHQPIDKTRPFRAYKKDKTETTYPSDR